MHSKLKRWLFAIRSNFWFIPTALSVIAIVAALLVAYADLALHGSPVPLVPYAGISIESARLVLSTIAGSMITIASLVFSMTLVALTMISQQLGPRILLRFMDDRPTQVVLGLFIATFLFSLIVLIRIDHNSVSGRVPGLGVVIGGALVVLALGTMIHFIHHIANRIQADTLIATLGDDLRRATAAFVDSSQQEWDVADADEVTELEKVNPADDAQTILARRSGYVRGVDEAIALSLTEEHDLLVRLAVHPGTFVLAGTPLLRVSAVAGTSIDDNLEEKLSAIVLLGDRRTPEASIEFEIGALVEVALRALSPGINDPFTAMTCIDRLADGLRSLMERDCEHRVLRDDNETIRAVMAPEPFERYLHASFHPISGAAQRAFMVTDKLRNTLESLRTIATHEKHRTAIDRMLEELKQAA